MDRRKSGNLLAKALTRAIQWECSLADAWAEGSKEHAESMRLVEEFRGLLKSMGYREPGVRNAK